MDTHHRTIEQMQAGAQESSKQGDKAVAVNGSGAGIARNPESPLGELHEMLNNTIEQARSIC